MDLQADRIEWVNGVATAVGHVVAVQGDQRLVGERAELTEDVLFIFKGTYTRPDGDVAFDEAEVGVGDGAGRLVTVHARFGGATLDAATMFVGSEWRAEDAFLRPCACQDGRPAALGFSARSIVVEPGKVAIIRGGVVRIFSLPVIPVPYWREPLDPRRFRLLFPELGLGTFGVFAAQHATFGLGDWRFEAGPAWRQDRGFRGQLDLGRPASSGVTAASASRLQGDVGWDESALAVRGALATKGGMARGNAPEIPARTGWDVSVVSDPAYVADYGVDYVSRGVGYHESRATLAYGPLRGTAWYPDDGSAGELATVRARQEFGTAVAFAPNIGLAAVGSDTDVVTPRVTVGGDARAAGEFSILHEEVRLSGGFIAAGSETQGSGVRLVNRIDVPVWSSVGNWRIQWEPGVVVMSEAQANAGMLTTESLTGPDIRVQTALGGSVVTAEGSVVWDGTAWHPTGVAGVSVSPVTGRIQVDERLQLAEVRLTTPVGGNLGFAHSLPEDRRAEMALLWASVDSHFGRFVGGASSGYDLAQNALSGVGVYAGYDDGCSAAVVTGAVSPDRLLPDVGLKVTLRK